MANWNKIRKEWEQTDISLVALAEKYDINLNSLKSRKSRDAKDGNQWTRVATPKKVATKKEKLQPSDKVASSNVPKKRSGNPNPQNQFSERNRAALKHGFYEKYLPEESLELFNALETMNTADMLWDQIKIMYTNIMRAQRIMNVESKDEMIKELKREKLQGGKNPSQEKEYEFQFAWERQAQLLTAQARAISELRSLINQFIKTADEADERRLKIEQMGLSIEKTKIEIDSLQKDDGETGPIQIQIVSKKRE